MRTQLRYSWGVAVLSVVVAGIFIGSQTAYGGKYDSGWGASSEFATGTSLEFRFTRTDKYSAFGAGHYRYYFRNPSQEPITFSYEIPWIAYNGKTLVERDNCITLAPGQVYGGLSSGTFFDGQPEQSLKPTITTCHSGGSRQSSDLRKLLDEVPDQFGGLEKVENSKAVLDSRLSKLLTDSTDTIQRSSSGATTNRSLTATSREAALDGITRPNQQQPPLAKSKNVNRATEPNRTSIDANSGFVVNKSAIRELGLSDDAWANMAFGKMELNRDGTVTMEVNWRGKWTIEGNTLRLEIEKGNKNSYPYFKKEFQGTLTTTESLNTGGRAMVYEGTLKDIERQYKSNYIGPPKKKGLVLYPDGTER